MCLDGVATGMELRPATPDDAEAIARVGTATWHDTYDDLIGPETVTALTDEWYDPGEVRGYFDADGFGAWVAVEEDGEVVGYAYSRPDADEADVWHLPAVYVHPAKQGRGIGARLTERVESDAREADASVVRLVVLAENDAARGFYEARGYEQVDERVESVVEGTTELVYETRV